MLTPPREDTLAFAGESSTGSIDGNSFGAYTTKWTGNGEGGRTTVLYIICGVYNPDQNLVVNEVPALNCASL